MFIVQGAALLVMDKPGGQVPQDFTGLLTGSAIPDVLPAAIVVLGVTSAALGGAATFPLRHRALCGGQRRRSRGARPASG